MDRTRWTSAAAVAMFAILTVLLIGTPQPPPGIVVPQREGPAVPEISRIGTTSVRPAELGAVSPNTPAAPPATSTAAPGQANAPTLSPAPGSPAITSKPGDPGKPGEPNKPGDPSKPADPPKPPQPEPPEPPQPVPHFLTVSCPTPVIGWVPPGARAEVNTQFAELDRQIAQANGQLRALTSVPDPMFIQNTIVGPLVNRRIATLDRIAIAIGRFGPRPQGLERFAPCSVG